MMKILLSTLLMVSANAFAQAPNQELGPASQEEVLLAYHAVCTPGSANYGTKESTDFRGFMLELLKEPTATLTKLKADESFAGQIGLGVTCGLLVILKDTLNEKGCTLPEGGKIDASEAIRQCDEIVKEIQKSEPTEEVEPQP